MIVGDFAVFEVVRVERDGVYLDWGRPRDLYLPREEQRGRLFEGDRVVVYITQDRRMNTIASMHLRDYLDEDTSKLRPNQRVELLIFGESDMGFEAIVDQKYLGMLYHNEVFQDLERGSQLTGFVREVRADGKVDLMSQLRGTRGTPELGDRILDMLRGEDGFLAVTDKSDPELIYDVFGVSKKKFKIALGSLYKARKITLHDDGIRLV